MEQRCACDVIALWWLYTGAGREWDETLFLLGFHPFVLFDLQ